MLWQVPGDVMMTSRDISRKSTSQNALNMKLGQQVLRQKKIQMSIHRQVSDDVMMMSRDISKKYTSQNATNMKLGHWVLGQKKF